MVFDNNAHTLKLKSAVRGTLQPNASEVMVTANLRFRLRASTALARWRCWPLMALAARRSPGRRRKADRDKPINFSGDTGDVNLQTHGGTLTGHVIITQGTLEIHADRIVFKQNADNSMSATAYGNPVTFRQKRDGVDEYFEGYAQRVEYDGTKELLELFDRALLQRGQDEIRSNYISYNTATELFKAEGRAGTPSPIPRAPGRACAACSSRNPIRRPPARARTAGRMPARTAARRQPQRRGGRAARHAEAGRRARAARRQVSDPAAGGSAPASQLSVARLEKRYKARTVVHDVSLDVASGEVVGLLGPNGAGKTTCFYMIVGLVAADGGRIELDGRDLSRMPIHSRARLGLSYLPQEASIFRKLTVAENVRAILELQDLDADALANRLDALLDDLSISHLADAPALSLSGGERRRVEIARALATRPRFILLDEPFAGVDPIAVLDIQKIIGFLKERGIGVLITDHNVRETLGICDRAYIINEGRVLASGAPGEIVYNEAVRKVYLGEHFRL